MAGPKSPPQRQTGLVFNVRTATTRLQIAKGALAAALDIEASHGTPFLFVPVFMGVGAAVYFLHESEPQILPMLITFALLFLVWRYLLSLGKRAWIAGALLCMACGMIFAKAETLRVQSIMLGGSVTTTIDMQVLKVDRDGKRLRVLGQVLATREPTLQYQPERIRISMPASRNDIAAGDIISGLFGLRPPGGPVRPGSYDFAFHSYFAGVGASGFPMGPIAKMEAGELTGVAAVRFGLENLRAGIADKVRAAIPGTSGNVSAALIAGVTGGIDEINEEALRVTGLAHVLSISGLHMALVAGAVLFVVRIGLALFPAFASQYPVKKWAAGAALAASFCYLFLSGGAVATVRSFLMLAVMLGAVMLDRQALTLRNLAIAAIIILVLTPHEIMGPSFQMSFAATAALISAYGWVSRRRENAPTRQGNSGHWPMMRNVVMAAVLTPVVAGLATAIFSAWHFHRLAPMGLPANLAAMPVISFIIMPFAMIGTAAMPLGLEEWPLKIMGYGVDAMLWIARQCASISPPDTTGAIEPATFIFLVLALIATTLCQSRLRLAGLALAAAAVFVHGGKTAEVYISEDARLVAIAGSDGVLAVNRERPNAFTNQVWRNAAAADIVAKPEMIAGPEAVAPDAGTETPAERAAETSVGALSKAAMASPGRFVCAQNACFVSITGKAMIAWIDPSFSTLSIKTPARAKLAQATPESRSAANSVPHKSPSATLEESDQERQFARLFFQACSSADLVITASAIPFRNCGKGKATLIRASDLARKGAAEVQFHKPNSQAMIATGPEYANAVHETDDIQSNKGTSDTEIIQSDELDTKEKSTSRSTKAARSSSGTDVPHGSRAGPGGPSSRLFPEAAGITIRYAIGEPNRPWSRERIFSRAARNIPEFKRSASRKAMDTNASKSDQAPAPGDRTSDE